MKKTVIIAALPQELNNLENLFGIPIIYSGVGKVNAAISSTISFFSGYNHVINLGSCGSLNHSVGSILKINKFIQDIDCSPLCEYGTTFLDEKYSNIINEADHSFSCFTTDYFYDHNQKEKYSKYYLENIKTCDVFDMESFAIAKVCKKFKIGFSCYKWVSDDGDSNQWETSLGVKLDEIRNLIENEF
jgi:adenosylhomocysteine nucleosidase